MNQDDRTLRQQLVQSEREKAVLQQQLALQKYVADYEVLLDWPPIVTGNRRTQNELVQHRLLEAGVLYDGPMRTGELLQVTNAFIQDLESTDCFHSVGVEIGGKSPDVPQDGTPEPRHVHVKLKEKNWYRLHAGAGLKSDMFASSGGNSKQVSTDSVLPPAEFEVSAGLRNLAGCFDKTDLQYTLDTLTIGAWRLSHHRPLYAILPSIISDRLLQTDVGSQHTFLAQAALDTIDSDWISSYKLFQRYLSVQLASRKSQKGWASLEWFLGYRDLVPRRHASLPFHLSASPEITRMAGPSLKNSITANFEYDDAIREPTSQLPLDGVQLRWRTEWAAPPGDVSFFKTNASCACHWMVPETTLALHATGSIGWLHQLHTFRGTRQNATLPADRFIMGGTGSLRGFSTGGVGPRSKGTTDNPIGDVLGGNFAYSATAAISTAPPYNVMGDKNDPIRLFGFFTAGSCLGDGNFASLLPSTRVSAGVGIATQILGPRLEATYAWPLKYSPYDGRRRFQIGVTLSVT